MNQKKKTKSKKAKPTLFTWQILPDVREKINTLKSKHGLRTIASLLNYLVMNAE